MDIIGKNDSDPSIGEEFQKNKLAKQVSIKDNKSGNYVIKMEDLINIQ